MCVAIVYPLLIYLFQISSGESTHHKHMSHGQMTRIARNLFCIIESTCKFSTLVDLHDRDTKVRQLPKIYMLIMVTVFILISVGGNERGPN